MQTAELRAKLDRVQPGPVQVKLREKAVVNGVESSGLWPRVTLRLDGEEAVISLTEYAIIKKKEADKGKLTKLEVAILRICGVESRSMRAVHKDRGTHWGLKNAVNRIQSRIASAISKARTTKKLGTRVEAAQRKRRKGFATGELEESFRNLIFRGKVKLNDLTGSQIGKIWDRVRMEKIVEEVHER